MTARTETAAACSRPVRWPLVVLVVSVLVVFGRLCFSDFTSWDDGVTVYANPRLNPVTLDNLTFVWSHFAQGLYVPVTYSLWMAIALIARVQQPDERGVTLNPYLFHAANVLVHLLTSIVVYQLLLRVTRDSIAALFGALLWALHPMQVESVGWISGAKDLLAGCFGMIAVWRFVIRIQRASDHDRLIMPDAIGTVALILALLSKPSAMVMPAIALVIDWFLLRRSFRKALVSTAVWFVIALPLVVVARLAQGVHDSVKSPLLVRPLIAVDAIAFYLRKLLVPNPLGIDYGRTWKMVMHGPVVTSIWLMAVVITFILICRRKLRPWHAAGGLIFLVAILPVCGLFSFQFQYLSTTADHYVYVALLGPALMVSLFVLQHRSTTTYFALGSVLVIFAAMTVWQTQFWRNDISLYSHAIQVNPQSFLSHNNLGMAYQLYGDRAAAIAEYREAMRLTDEYPTAYENLARVLSEQGDVDGAIKVIEESIDIRARLPRSDYPNYMEDHNRVGQVLLQRGRYEDAIRHFEALLQEKPDHIEAQKYLKIAQEKLAQTRPATTQAVEPTRPGASGSLSAPR